jgi:hypothetical protein
MKLNRSWNIERATRVNTEKTTSLLAHETWCNTKKYALIWSYMLLTSGIKGEIFMYCRASFSLFSVRVAAGLQTEGRLFVNEIL